MKYSLALFFLFLVATTSRAQHSYSPDYKRQLNVYQDSLKILSRKMINDPTGPERMNANYSFTRLLVKALKTPHSFNFPFDSLKAISIRYSPDRKFRLMSWGIMYDDGSYRYYGGIQMNNPDGKLVLHGLVDFSPAIKHPSDTITSADRWYGAQYYNVIPVYSVRTPYYILLGWKGNTTKTTKKVVEILSFKNDLPVFGMPVFEGFKDRPQAKRIVFEYARQASMLLEYQSSAKTIVFDHLAPRDAKLVGKYEMYGPDLTYDGLKLIGDRLKLTEDLPLTNPPSPTDSKFINPVAVKDLIRKH